MRAILGAGLALSMAYGAVAEDKQDERIDGKLLVGKWEPKNPKQGAFVLEFTEKGKLTKSFIVGGKPYQMAGTFAVEGNKVVFVWPGDANMKIRHTHTVSKLTADELVSKDDLGKEDTLKRVKDNK